MSIVYLLAIELHLYNMNDGIAAEDVDCVFSTGLDQDNCLSWMGAASGFRDRQPLFLFPANTRSFSLDIELTS